MKSFGRLQRGFRARKIFLCQKRFSEQQTTAHRGFGGWVFRDRPLKNALWLPQQFDHSRPFTQLRPCHRFAYHGLQPPWRFWKITHELGENIRRSYVVGASKLRFGQPVNVFVCQLASSALPRHKQRDGRGGFFLFQLGFCLEQYRLGHALGLRIFRDELGELFLRAIPKPVVERIGRSLVSPVFSSKDCRADRPAKAGQCQQDENPSAAQRHVHDSKRANSAAEA